MIEQTPMDRAREALIAEFDTEWITINVPSLAKQLKRILADAGLVIEEGWRSISEAPRDGRWFIAVAPDWGAMRIVRFADKSDRLPTIHGEGMMWLSAPTHFRPLPFPPDDNPQETLG